MLTETNNKHQHAELTVYVMKILTRNYKMTTEKFMESCQTPQANNKNIELGC